MYSPGDEVSREEVGRVETPPATHSWCPIPHLSLVGNVERQLEPHGLHITEQVHCLTHDGARYFGLMQVVNGSNHPDYTRVLGLRNSHDQSISAGLVAGSRVMVCSNLAFSGEIKFGRKHTRNIAWNLTSLISQSLCQLKATWHKQDERIAAYKHAPLTDLQAHDFIVRAIDEAVLSPSKLPRVLEEWRHPRHETFEPRTCWSLFNGFTEVLKGRLHDLPHRTERLHRLMDQRVGLAA